MTAAARAQAVAPESRVQPLAQPEARARDSALPMGLEIPLSRRNELSFPIARADEKSGTARPSGPAPADPLQRAPTRERKEEHS
jgi:hypothetical protein